MKERPILTVMILLAIIAFTLALTAHRESKPWVATDADRMEASRQGRALIQSDTRSYRPAR